MKAVHLPHEPPSAAVLADLFLAQRALVTPAQLRVAGIGAPEQQLRVARGEWLWLEPGVIALRGAPSDWTRDPMIATLCAPSAAITAGTALRLHGSDGFADYEGQYVVARNGARPRLPEGFRVWQSRVLTEEDVMMLDGIRTVTLPVAQRPNCKTRLFCKTAHCRDVRW
jgi:hypothetical protein